MRIGRVEVVRLVVGPLKTNVYMLLDDTGHAAIVDAGPGSFTKILYVLDRWPFKVKYVFLTHAHFDHISDAGFIKDLTGADIVLHSMDREVARFSRRYAEAVGIRWSFSKEDIPIGGNEVFKFGDIEVRAIHTPGHTPGSVCYLVNNESLFSGDTLLHLSVGRTDLPGGSWSDMRESLKRLARLPPTTYVFPGHGRPTSIGDELAANPYLRRFRRT